MYAGVEDTAESVVSFLPLVEWGVHNVCRRECRFLLESTVKHLYVDQQLPDVRRHSRQDRIDYLNSEVPRFSIEPIFRTDVYLGIDADVAAAMALRTYRSEVKDAWTKFSAFVHPSRDQLQLRLRRAEMGAHLGFETTRELRNL